MKRLSAFWIFLVISAVLLVSCSPSLTTKTLKGTWVYEDSFTEEEIAGMLPDFGFDESEIAVAPKSGLAFVRSLEFLDSTYREGYDLADTRANFISYFDSLMEALYNNRVEIYMTDIEEEDFDDLDDFKGFIAYLYEYDTYEDLLSSFWLTTMGMYVGLDGEPIEEGTYSIDGNSIDMTPSGETESSYVDITMVSETEMVMSYSNTSVRMTKRT